MGKEKLKIPKCTKFEEVIYIIYRTKDNIINIYKMSAPNLGSTPVPVTIPTTASAEADRNAAFLAQPDNSAKLNFVKSLSHHSCT